jgi:predicted acetyltransferase
MQKLKLIKPTKDFEEQVLQTVQEFFDDNSNLHWTGWLKRYFDDYKWYLENVKNNENHETVETWHVIAKQFFLVRESDNRLLWFINTRLELNDWLLAHGWHIWYSIRPSERKKGYATAQLFSALDIYDKMWVEKVLLTCDKTNIWSAKTIQKCGWILENEIIDPEDWELIQRYRIDVKNWIEIWKRFFEDKWIDITIQ